VHVKDTGGHKKAARGNTSVVEFAVSDSQEASIWADSSRLS
jgi:hypothetical protein